MRRVLPTIVLSQFFCTSLWFAGNAVASDLASDLGQGDGFLGQLTGSIQLGFVLGTLVYAVLGIADRFAPAKVFFGSAVLASLFNLGICLPGVDATQVLFFRFLTGFFLAGIYPVGMKIAADHYAAGLGKSLGFLVSALVLGTAAPHLLKNLTAGLPWAYVLYGTTALACLGGAAMWTLVPNGPHRKAATTFQVNAFLLGFKNPSFRAAALGYFGHMWELYAFWAFVPLMLQFYNKQQGAAHLPVSLLSFLVIAVGAVGCVLSGFLANRWGTKKLAAFWLSVSGSCCLLSPLFFHAGTPYLFLAFLLVWGIAVVADSPLFSTLVAQNAPVEARGSSLTIVNGIGFFITIISILLVNQLATLLNPTILFTLLALGPVLGLVALVRRAGAKRNN